MIQRPIKIIIFAKALILAEFPRFEILLMTLLFD